MLTCLYACAFATSRHGKQFGCRHALQYWSSGFVTTCTLVPRLCCATPLNIQIYECISLRQCLSLRYALPWPSERVAVKPNP